MKKFLSIGDVAKLKGVSVKSLRYYDEIGILTPAYINQETKYRYYTLDQLLVVDTIYTFIELGIPLKDFNKYKTKDDKFDLDRLLSDGRKLAAKKIASITELLKKIEALSESISHLQEAKEKQGNYFRYFNKRAFLVKAWNGQIDDAVQYAKTTTALYFKSKELGRTSLYKQGLLFCHKEQKVETFTFVEIKPEENHRENILVLEPENYKCSLHNGTELAQIEHQYTNTSFPTGTIIICEELCDAYIDTYQYYIEVQIPDILVLHL